MEATMLEEISGKIAARADELIFEKGRAVLAVDGRCASGKTTLAEILREDFTKLYGSCEVVHLDDFFLRREQRTAERLSEIGGNFDRERFLAEVLIPLRKQKSGEVIEYGVFSCSVMDIMESKKLYFSPITVIEGSYSHHPELRELYDLRVFLSVDPTEQIERIKRRDGEEKAKIFAERWIPLEEKYFREFAVMDSADIVFVP